MSLNDRQHVEAVAIIRRMAEAKRIEGDPEAWAAARGWLRENHPSTEMYLAALHREEQQR
jgi:hypothetical protein